MLLVGFDGVSTPPGKSGIFLLKIPGPGKSRKITLELKVLENIVEIVHFSSGSSGKQAAVVQLPVGVDY